MHLNNCKMKLLHFGPLLLFFSSDSVAYGQCPSNASFFKDKLDLPKYVERITKNAY